MSGITWIKLSTGFYDDEKIKLIESLPEGDATIIIFQRLLILAGKINEKGKISLSKDQPYTPEMLAVLFNRNPQITKNALVTLQQFGMINICEKGFIFVANWGHHQNIEGMERVKELTRKRVAKHREKKKLLTEGNEENVTLQKRYVTQQNKNKIKSKNKESKTFSEDSIEFQLSAFLYDEIKKRDSKFKQPDFQKWSDHIEKLIRLDQRLPDEIKSVIEWVQQNDFWQTNILSTDKLRKQFSKLLMQLQNDRKKSGTNPQQPEQNLYKKTQTELLYEEAGL